MERSFSAMSVQFRGAIAALTLGLGLSAAASAQTRPTVAIIPTQYFSATEQSADNVTQALVQQYQREGYTVVPTDRARATFDAMGLSRNVDFGDRTIRQFGRRLGVGLVVHPQLLAEAVPADLTDRTGGRFSPGAVLYTRVVNTRTGGAIFTRQIGYAVADTGMASTVAALPPEAASDAVTRLTQRYFERVAGSRQEYGRMPRRRHR